MKRQFTIIACALLSAGCATGAAPTYSTSPTFPPPPRPAPRPIFHHDDLTPNYIGLEAQDAAIIYEVMKVTPPADFDASAPPAPRPAPPRSTRGARNNPPRPAPPPTRGVPPAPRPVKQAKPPARIGADADGFPQTGAEWNRSNYGAPPPPPRPSRKVKVTVPSAPGKKSF
jgi:hypothetical protein